MERKEFITGLATIGFGIACASLLNACNKKNEDSPASSDNGTTPHAIDFTLDLNDPANSALNITGGFINKSVSNASIVIINMGGKVFNALSRICSHANCLVNYDSVVQKLPCPCHGSKFDLNGMVLNGPATKSLIKYNTSLNGSILHVFG